MSLYYEPHCDYDEASLRQTGAEGVDVVIAPASSQLVGGYELVSHQDAPDMVSSKCSMLVS